MQLVIGDGVLHCQVLGDGPPILFIHGFPLSHEMWLPVADQLRDRWRCILPDLRGHGRSAVSPEVTITQFADDLAALLDAISETRPVVPVGLSMGGVIALEFFRQQRARLRALVLANCRANAETPEGVARRAALAQSVLRDGSQVAADAMICDLFAPAAPAGLRSEWRARIARTPPAGVAAASRAPRRPPRVVQYVAADRLPDTRHRGRRRHDHPTGRHAGHARHDSRLPLRRHPGCGTLDAHRAARHLRHRPARIRI
jgi:pimeloyl-ACP methyl ester carboxylesterase